MDRSGMASGFFNEVPKDIRECIIATRWVIESQEPILEIYVAVGVENEQRICDSYTFAIIANRLFL